MFMAKYAFDSCDMGICWYAIDKSSTENTVPPERCLAYKSSIRVNGYASGLHSLFTVTLKTPQIRKPPLVSVWAQ